MQGTLDPVDSRIVIHGWFSSPAPFFTGLPPCRRRCIACQGSRQAHASCIATIAAIEANPTTRVLHPHAGPLTEEQAGPALRAGLATLHRALGALSHSAAGCVVLRLRVAGDTGRVTGLRWLVNTFIADPWPGKQSWVVVDDILRLVEVHARAWRFPSSGGGDSHLTLPITLPEPAPTL